MDMIMRFSESSEDVEILTQFDNGAIQEKYVNIKDCAKEFLKVTNIDYDALTINNLDGNIIYYTKGGQYERYIIRLPERKIKATYKNKAYTLVHPDSIFILKVFCKNKCYEQIEAFCIKDYKGKKTKLYKYPFPNMLSSNSICTGTISKDATDPINAILNVIEGNYTHEHTSSNKIKSTDKFFEKIKSAFPYNILTDLGMTLEYKINQLSK